MIMRRACCIQQKQKNGAGVIYTNSRAAFSGQAFHLPVSSRTQY